MAESSLDLHAAVCCNDTEQVQNLLEAGHINFNEKDIEWGYRTPLHWAAQKGYVDCAKILLDFGANGTARMAFGATPAHCAAETGRVLVLKLLVKAKWSVTRTNDFGERPIDRAIFFGQKSCVEYLQQVQTEAIERRKARAEQAALLKQKAAKLGSLQNEQQTVKATGLRTNKGKLKKKGTKASLITSLPLLEEVSPNNTPPEFLSTTTTAVDGDISSVISNSTNNETPVEDVFNSDEDIDDDPVPHDDVTYLAWLTANMRDKEHKKGQQQNDDDNSKRDENNGGTQNANSKKQTTAQPPVKRSATALATNNNNESSSNAEKAVQK